MRKKFHKRDSVGCRYQLNVGLTETARLALAEYTISAGFPSATEAVRSLVIARLQDRGFLGAGNQAGAGPSPTSVEH
jgi:hypothetical protein